MIKQYLCTDSLYLNRLRRRREEKRYVVFTHLKETSPITDKLQESLQRKTEKNLGWQMKLTEKATPMASPPVKIPQFPLRTAHTFFELGPASSRNRVAQFSAQYFVCGICLSAR